MNTKLWAFSVASVIYLLAMVEFGNGCASTSTGPATVAPTVPTSGRKRRNVEFVTEPTKIPAMISALTFFKFNEAKNKENADEVEEQLKEFVSVEQINESKFGKAERILGDDKGFLRISYTLSEGSKHCEELVQLATKAINLAENVAEGDVICNHENIEIKKID